MRALIIRLPYQTIRYESVKSFSVLRNDTDPTSPPFHFMLRPDYGLGVHSAVVGASPHLSLDVEVQRICPMYHWEAAVKALDEATCVLAKLQLPDGRCEAGDYPILNLVPFTTDGQDDWAEEYENARQREANPGREQRVIDLEEGHRPTLTDVAQDSQPVMPNFPADWTTGVMQSQQARSQAQAIDTAVAAAAASLPAGWRPHEPDHTRRSCPGS